MKLDLLHLELRRQQLSAAEIEIISFQPAARGWIVTFNVKSDGRTTQRLAHAIFVEDRWHFPNCIIIGDVK